MLPNPFKDLKIIELASILAGPHVGMFFAEFGANVVKIENKTTSGDLTRKWKLPSENSDSPSSAYYESINFSKTKIMADLNDPNDFDLVMNHIQDADIVISNFRDRTALKKKLDYANLKKINPKLIYAQLIGFLDQPDRPAFDVVLQAEAGFLSMSGQLGNPVKMPVALIDVLAAHQLKEAILIALLNRNQTQTGSYIKVSLFQSAVSSLINQATNYLMADHIPQPIGMAHPNIAPYGDAFITKDKRTLVLAVGSDRQFQELCKILDIDQLAEHPDFKNNQSRLNHRETLNSYLAEAFKKKDSESLQKAFNNKQVPVGLIRNMAEVFELEEAKRLVISENDEQGRPTHRVSSHAFHFIDF